LEVEPTPDIFIAGRGCEIAERVDRHFGNRAAHAGQHNFVTPLLGDTVVHRRQPEKRRSSLIRGTVAIHVFTCKGTAGNKN
jgi:hypothetical protein